MIFLNHKMNLTLDEVNNYIEALKNYKEKIIVLPTALYAKEFINSGYKVGLQNIYYEEKGMYTGEISPYQAFQLGASYVLIGHYERRSIFGENNEMVNKKIKSALKNKLKVVLCVGDNDDNNDFLTRQIKECLKDVQESVIIAYEPIYAIGTGIIPKIEDIQNKVNYIKSLTNSKVLYGGSINAHNIDELKTIKNLDGFLIGKASIDAQEVIKILEVASK